MRNATVHNRHVIPNKKVPLSIIEPAVSITDSVAIRVVRDGRVVEEHSSKPTKKGPSLIQSVFKYVYNAFKSGMGCSRSTNRCFTFASSISLSLALLLLTGLRE
jgi:hypothetical protein